MMPLCIAVTLLVMGISLIPHDASEVIPEVISATLVYESEDKCGNAAISSTVATSSLFSVQLQCPAGDVARYNEPDGMSIKERRRGAGPYRSPGDPTHRMSRVYEQSRVHANRIYERCRSTVDISYRALSERCVLCYDRCLAVLHCGISDLEMVWGGSFVQQGFLGLLPTIGNLPWMLLLLLFVLAAGRLWLLTSLWFWSYPLYQMFAFILFHMIVGAVVCLAEEYQITDGKQEQGMIKQLQLGLFAGDAILFLVTCALVHRNCNVFYVSLSDDIDSDDSDDNGNEDQDDIAGIEGSSSSSDSLQDPRITESTENLPAENNGERVFPAEPKTTGTEPIAVTSHAQATSSAGVPRAASRPEKASGLISDVEQVYPNYKVPSVSPSKKVSGLISDGRANTAHPSSELRPPNELFPMYDTFTHATKYSFAGAAIHHSVVKPREHAEETIAPMDGITVGHNSEDEVNPHVMPDRKRGVESITVGEVGDSNTKSAKKPRG